MFKAENTSPHFIRQEGIRRQLGFRYFAFNEISQFVWTIHHIQFRKIVIGKILHRFDHFRTRKKIIQPVFGGFIDVDIRDDVVDQIFDFMVRDFSRHALSLYSKPSSSETQMASCLKMIRKPVLDEARYQRVWQQVHDLQDEYEMAP